MGKQEIETATELKTNKKLDYKPEFDEFIKVPETSKDNAGNEVAGFRLIPNKLILEPTAENPFHKQGEEYEVGYSAAVEHIRKGLANFKRTKEENDKIKLKKAAK